MGEGGATYDFAKFKKTQKTKEKKLHEIETFLDPKRRLPTDPQLSCLPSQWRIQRGASDTRLHGPKFSSFHAIFQKIWQNCILTPPLGGLAPPPMGNSGSPPASIYVSTT